MLCGGGLLFFLIRLLFRFSWTAELGGRLAKNLPELTLAPPLPALTMLPWPDEDGSEAVGCRYAAEPKWTELLATVVGNENTDEDSERGNG